jgi:hypothetical protein
MESPTWSLRVEVPRHTQSSVGQRMLTAKKAQPLHYCKFSLQGTTLMGAMYKLTFKDGAASWKEKDRFVAHSMFV